MSDSDETAVTLPSGQTEAEAAAAAGAAAAVAAVAEEQEQEARTDAAEAAAGEAAAIAAVSGEVASDAAEASSMAVAAAGEAEQRAEEAEERAEQAEQAAYVLASDFAAFRDHAEQNWTRLREMLEARNEPADEEPREVVVTHSQPQTEPEQGEAGEDESAGTGSVRKRGRRIGGGRKR